MQVDCSRVWSEGGKRKVRERSHCNICEHQQPLRSECDMYHDIFHDHSVSDVFYVNIVLILVISI